MNNINKVKVMICGKEYNLQTDETPEYIVGLAARLDKEINDLVRAKPNFGVQNASVFIALTALDTALKANSSIDNMRTQMKAYVDDAAKARAAESRLRTEIRELRELKAHAAELEKENKELKKKLEAYDCEQLVLENTIDSTVTIYAGTDSESKSEDTPADKADKKSAGEKAAEVKSEAVTDKAEPKADGVSSDGAEKNKKKDSEKGDGNERHEQQHSVGSGEADGKAEDDGGSTLHDDVTEAAPAEKNTRKGKRKRR